MEKGLLLSWQNANPWGLKWFRYLNYWIWKNLSHESFIGSALNAFIDLTRRKQVILVEGNSIPDKEYIAYDHENEVGKEIQLAILREGIELLPHRQRFIIKGCLQDKKVNQIADDLNVKPSTVYTQREVAIKKLRDYFRSKGYRINCN